MKTLKNVEKFRDLKILDCHYAYIAPPSIQELEIRIVRNRATQETKQSLEQKLREAKVEMERVQNSEWVDLILVNEHQEKFLKASTVKLESLYNVLKSGTKKRRRSSVEAQMMAQFS